MKNFVGFLGLLAVLCGPAFAQEAKPELETVAAEAAAAPAAPAEQPTAAVSEEPTGLPFPTATSHMILMDAETGTVLAQRNASEKMYPSSMSKLMTIYMIFDELKKGTLKLEDSFSVSEKAWAIQGSKMWVPIHGQVSIEDLIRGIAIQSGNDACIVVAEGLAGSEEAFAERMNKKAIELGMKGSHFVNASGWPDENHYSTAADLAILASRLISDFPEYYHYFAEKEYTFNNIRQYNRNPLLENTALGVDGLKTGHTEAAGYGIVLSAKQPDGRRLILVVNGLPSMQARGQEGEAILSWGFRNFELVSLAQAGSEIARAKVWLGQSDEVSLTVEKPIVMTLPKAERDKVNVEAVFDAPINAPVAKGQKLGTLVVTLPSGITREEALIAAEAVEKKGAFARIPTVIGHWLGL